MGVDSEKHPMMAMMKAAQGKTRMHMPGHKGRGMKWLSVAMDMTELRDTDDLFAASSGIDKSKRAMAASASAGATIMLTGGSTSGMIAMLLSAAGPDEAVIMHRGVHHSAVSGCILGGIKPIWVGEELDGQQMPALREEAVLKAISSHPEARAVLITRPDYYGRVMPLQKIVAAAHERGMLVLVDEAHGAHFNWWDEPAGAARLGADYWIQSAHKTLGALTPGAWLHMRDAEWLEHTRNRLRLVHTSSPSFLVMTSLDETRAWMDENGERALKRLAEWAQALRSRVEAMPGLRDAAREFEAYDPTRVVIDVSGRGLTGWRAQAAMSGMGVEVEMADHRRVVAILSVHDRKEDIERLGDALWALPFEMGNARNAASPVFSQAAMSPRQAALGKVKKVPFDQAAGCVCARSVGLYPPGIAWMAPGDRISRMQVSSMRRAMEAGGTPFGLAEEGQIWIVDEAKTE